MVLNNSSYHRVDKLTIGKVSKETSDAGRVYYVLDIEIKQKDTTTRINLFSDSKDSLNAKK